MNIQGIVCPISIEKIDGNVSRLTVFLNVILMGFFLYTKSLVFIGIVTIDYLIRAVWKIEYSPLRYIAFLLASALKFQKKPISLAQKIFASRLGVICAFTALVLQLLGYTTGALIVAAILMLLSFMDSVFNFCVGCIIYQYGVYPFYKDKD